jgi:hypothetical protein
MMDIDEKLARLYKRAKGVFDLYSQKEALYPGELDSLLLAMEVLKYLEEIDAKYSKQEV